MPGPEQKPEIIHADDIERTELPVRVDDGNDTVIVHKNNSGTIFMRYWHEEQSIVSVAITPESVHIAFADGTQLLHPRNKITESPPPPLQEETQQEPEKEKVVKLRGRIGIPVRVMESPTSGKMAVTQFSEHPDRAAWSYSNTLPEKPEKQTVWWPLAAFDDRVPLLEKATKGKPEYDITCYLRSWEETDSKGKTKTVNGLYLLSIEPHYPRSNRSPGK